jgi:hypothetical protein
MRLMRFIEGDESCWSTAGGRMMSVNELDGEEGKSWVRRT